MHVAADSQVSSIAMLYCADLRVTTFGAEGAILISRARATHAGRVVSDIISVRHMSLYK